MTMSTPRLQKGLYLQKIKAHKLTWGLIDRDKIPKTRYPQFITDTIGHISNDVAKCLMHQMSHQFITAH